MRKFNVKWKALSLPSRSDMHTVPNIYHRWRLAKCATIPTYFDVVCDYWTDSRRHEMCLFYITKKQKKMLTTSSIRLFCNRSSVGTKNKHKRIIRLIYKFPWMMKWQLGNTKQNYFHLFRMCASQQSRRKTLKPNWKQSLPTGARESLRSLTSRTAENFYFEATTLPRLLR